MPDYQRKYLNNEQLQNLYGQVLAQNEERLALVWINRILEPENKAHKVLYKQMRERMDALEEDLLRVTGQGTAESKTKANHGDNGDSSRQRAESLSN